MFILRVINKDKAVSNYELGNSYNYYRKSEHCYDKFIDNENKGVSCEGSVGIITGQSSGIHHVIECKEYWIMTSDGKTFERIN